MPGGALRVLVAGGGVAALETVLALRRLAAERVAVTLLAPDAELTYRPASVVWPFGGTPVALPRLAELADDAGTAHVAGRLAAVEPDARVAVTAAGERLPYHALVVATGAVAREAVPGALTFRGGEDVPAFAGLLSRLRSRTMRRMAFAVPAAASWPLPLYELALLTSAWMAREGVRADLHVVTHEPAPLALFGEDVGGRVLDLLERRGIAFRPGAALVRFEDGVLALRPGGRLEVDRVVALPRLEAPALPGLPSHETGFLPADAHGRVDGLADVYAAGDVTARDPKQGGLAAQQADAVAAAVAAEAGAPVEPRPYRPVLRSTLLTGAEPVYLRAELDGGRPTVSEVTGEAPWWPPAKVVGRHLGPVLARVALESGAGAGRPGNGGP